MIRRRDGSSAFLGRVSPQMHSSMAELICCLFAVRVLVRLRFFIVKAAEDEYGRKGV